MLKLGYRNFVFPHNPKSLKIRYSRQIKAFHPVNNAPLLQDLGADFRIVSGHGEFYGVNAYVDAIKLQNEFENVSDGQLVVPGLQPFFAKFVKFNLDFEAGPEIISYNFEFWEVVGKAITNTNKVTSYTCNEQDNLWTISAAFKVSVEELLKFNPSIKNPYDVKVGEVIQLTINN